MGSEEIEFSASVLRLLRAGVQRMPKIQLDFMTDELKLSVKGLFINADGYLEKFWLLLTTNFLSLSLGWL